MSPTCVAQEAMAYYFVCNIFKLMWYQVEKHPKAWSETELHENIYTQPFGFMRRMISYVYLKVWMLLYLLLPSWGAKLSFSIYPSFLCFQKLFLKMFHFRIWKKSYLNFKKLFAGVPPNFKKCSKFEKYLCFKKCSLQYRLGYEKFLVF